MATLPPGDAGLARRIGPFAATMIVMGGIVGSGIFVNPHEVARELPRGGALLAAWALGGAVAMAGALVYAELAARRPGVGGQYAYLRDAYHPLAAFLYGWTLLLVVQTGGMAAVALIFARFTRTLVGGGVPEWLLAMGALAALTAVNCLGVALGSGVQAALMVLKIAAIAGLVACGLAVAAPAPAAAAAASPAVGLFDFGAAMAPVLFAYGGWQTSSFVSGELKDPGRDLPRALILGVLGVIALYLGVNWASLRVLGAAGLAQTPAPASAIMERALGPAGGRLIAAGIAISTLGFLSQSMLTAPRVYFAMARDRTFFQQVGRVHPRTRVPAVAIALQGGFAMLLTAWGQYRRILDYLIAVDFLFFGLTATCVFVFRRRDGAGGEGFRVPGHPVTTAAFVAVCWLFVANLVAQRPGDTLLGMAVLLTGVPVFFLWKVYDSSHDPAGRIGRADPPR
jgi:APA family basic amino acid/polyamine antiporter